MKYHKDVYEDAVDSGDIETIESSENLTESDSLIQLILLWSPV